MRIDCGWPPMLCMQDACSSRLDEVSYLLFGSTVLKMSTYPTKGKALTFVGAIVAPQVVREATVVCVIMLDGHAVCPRVLFERVLRFHRFFAGERLLKIHEGYVAVVVDENRRCTILELRRRRTPVK